MWWDGLSTFSFSGGSYKLNRTKKGAEPSCTDRLKDLQGVVFFILSIAICYFILSSELKYMGQIKTSKSDMVLLKDHYVESTQSLKLVLKTSYQSEDLLSLVRNAGPAENLAIPRLTSSFKESDWKAVEKYVCQYQKVFFQNIRLTNSQLVVNQFDSSCLLDTWSVKNEIGAVFLFAVGKNFDQYSGSSNVYDTKTKAWKNETGNTKVLLSSHENTDNKLQMTFANELQGVRLRHELFYTSDNDKSLFSGWTFKSSDEWTDFKQSYNTTELAVIK